jgi:hypothetical protein
VILAVVAIGVLGVAPHTASTLLHQVTAWLANDKQGSVTQASGLDGRPDARVAIPGTAGHRIKVIQDGSTVLIEDLTTGQVSSLDPNQLTVGAGVQIDTAGTQIVAGDGIAYLVDPAAGTVQRIDPTSLTTIGAPLGGPALLAPLGTAELGSDGTLWVPDEATGLLVPIHGGAAGTPRRVGSAGDALEVTIADGQPAAVDTTAGTVTAFPGGGVVTVRLPVTGGAGAILQPASVAGTVLPLLVKGANQLVLVDTARGSASTVVMTNVARDRLDAPLMLGRYVYVPDESRGVLVTYDTGRHTQDTPVPVDSRPGEIDAFVQNGELWANAPEDAQAVVVNADGSTYAINKYQTGLAGGSPSSSPTPTGQAGGVPSRSSAPAVVVTPPSRSTIVAAPPTTTVPSRSPAPVPTSSAPASPTPPPPVGPANVTETPAAGSITVTFTPVATGTPTSYRLIGYPSGATVSPSASLSPTGTFSFTVSGSVLSCARTYAFTVEAVFVNGTKGTTGAAVRPCLAPDAPTGLRAASAPGAADRLDVSWSSGGDNGGAATYDVTANGNSSQTTGTTATITGLLPGHSYPVSVTASNAAGTSSSAGTSGTPGGSLTVNPDFTYFTGSSSSGLCPVSPPVASQCWFQIAASPAPSGNVGNAYPGDSFTAYCESSGGTITNTKGTSSSVWYYIAINGSYGFGNSLWWGQSGTDGLPPCPSGL